MDYQIRDGIKYLLKSEDFSLLTREECLELQKKLNKYIDVTEDRVYVVYMHPWFDTGTRYIVPTLMREGPLETGLVRYKTYSSASREVGHSGPTYSLVDNNLIKISNLKNIEKDTIIVHCSNFDPGPNKLLSYQTIALANAAVGAYKNRCLSAKKGAQTRKELRRVISVTDQEGL